VLKHSRNQSKHKSVIQYRAVIWIR